MKKKYIIFWILLLMAILSFPIIKTTIENNDNSVIHSREETWSGKITIYDTNFVSGTTPRMHAFSDIIYRFERQNPGVFVNYTIFDMDRYMVAVASNTPNIIALPNKSINLNTGLLPLDDDGIYIPDYLKTETGVYAKALAAGSYCFLINRDYFLLNGVYVEDYIYSSLSTTTEKIESLCEAINTENILGVKINEYTNPVSCIENDPKWEICFSTLKQNNKIYVSDDTKTMFINNEIGILLCDAYAMNNLHNLDMEFEMLSIQEENTFKNDQILLYGVLDSGSTEENDMSKSLLYAMCDLDSGDYERMCLFSLDKEYKLDTENMFLFNMDRQRIFFTP